MEACSQAGRLLRAVTLGIGQRPSRASHTAAIPSSGSRPDQPLHRPDQRGSPMHDFATSGRSQFDLCPLDMASDRS